MSGIDVLKRFIHVLCLIVIVRSLFRADIETTTTNHSLKVADKEHTQNITIYVGLVVASLVLSLTRALLFFYILINSSQHLHNRMFAAILRAPIYFFDSNPVGRCRVFVFVFVFYDLMMTWWSIWES